MLACYFLSSKQTSTIISLLATCFISEPADAAGLLRAVGALPAFRRLGSAPPFRKLTVDVPRNQYHPGPSTINVNEVTRENKNTVPEFSFGTIDFAFCSRDQFEAFEERGGPYKRKEWIQILKDLEPEFPEYIKSYLPYEEEYYLFESIVHELGTQFRLNLELVSCDIYKKKNGSITTSLHLDPKSAPDYRLWIPIHSIENQCLAVGYSHYSGSEDEEGIGKTVCYQQTVMDQDDWILFNPKTVFHFVGDVRGMAVKSSGIHLQPRSVLLLNMKVSRSSHDRKAKQVHSNVIHQEEPRRN